MTGIPFCFYCVAINPTSLTSILNISVAFFFEGMSLSEFYYITVKIIISSIIKTVLYTCNTFCFVFEKLFATGLKHYGVAIKSYFDSGDVLYLRWEMYLP